MGVSGIMVRENSGSRDERVVVHILVEKSSSYSNEG